MHDSLTPSVEADEELVNSLSALCSALGADMGGHGYSWGTQLSEVDTLFKNNRWYLISNMRNLLSQLFAEHGIIQTLVEQPVDDAFSVGFDIKTSMLDADDIEKLTVFMTRNRVIEHLKQARKWARLFGGGALIINTPQDPATPMNFKEIGPNTPVSFIPVDMWELYGTSQNSMDGRYIIGGGQDRLSTDLDYYSYYGQQIHKSRVYRIEGKQAPSFIRPRLRGWGMSEVERMVRSLNQFMKNQDVIFSLLDEAKVDVYGITGFNTSLLQPGGTNDIAKRVQLGNQVKGLNNALVMDAKDTYAQKQVTFAGLADVLLQIRQGIAADVKFPMTKLFGISAAGFNSGEDDIENYNSMCESEIRSKDEYIVVDVINICCQKVFGFMCDDMQIKWRPMRKLNALEEEKVKDSQFNRVTAGYAAGLVQDFEAKESINKGSLLPSEIDENAPAGMPIEGDYSAKAEGGEGTGKQAQSEA